MACVASMLAVLVHRDVAVGVIEAAAVAVGEGEPVHEQALDLRPHGDEAVELRVLLAFHDGLGRGGELFPGLGHLKVVFSSRSVR